jgi:DNA polymerase epsilon subunit 1
LIYHVDVAAMYPNIILSNRLQPVAIVNENICAGCIFNKEENDCKRKLEWQWKGEVFPLNKNEYEMVKTRLNQEEDILQERENLKGEKKSFGF